MSQHQPPCPRQRAADRRGSANRDYVRALLARKQPEVARALARALARAEEELRAGSGCPWRGPGCPPSPAAAAGQYATA